MWNTFSQDPFSTAVYLETLEPFILSDQLTRLPTNIVQQLVTHYQARDKLPGLEACLTHLAVDCLDIHQVHLTVQLKRGNYRLAFKTGVW